MASSVAFALCYASQLCVLVWVLAVPYLTLWLAVAAGINTGVMLVRNTDFSRHVMDLTLHFGQFPVNMSTEQACHRCDIVLLPATS